MTGRAAASSRAREARLFHPGSQPDVHVPTTREAFLESRHGRLRDECLIAHQFGSVENARTEVRSAGS